MSRFPLPLLVGFFLFFGSLPAFAQDAPKPDAPAAKEAPEEAPAERPLAPKEEEKPAPDESPTLEGDRKIYVPFEDLDGVFEKEGQGVFVPYEEFMKLWEANLDRRTVPAEPPVPYLITRARYEGRVEGDLALVSAEVEFETFTAGWSAVSLGFSGVAMGEATICRKPATLDAGPKGFRVLVPEKGSYTLKLTFVAPVAKSEDLRTVAFRVPSTPVSRLVFDVPEEDARVTVEPNLATTRTEPGSGVTRVMAYVGAAEALKIAWRPKPPEVETGPALVFADASVVAAVEEASLRTRVTVDYRIYRAPVEALRLSIPEGNRVLFVEGEGIRSWDVSDGALGVALAKPVTDGYRLAVTLERDRPESGDVAVPAVRVLDVAREQGFVAVRAPEAVKVVPTPQGLYRVGFETLPKELRTPDLVLAWRYPAAAWTLSLSVDRIEPRVEVAGRTRIGIDEQGVAVTDVFTYAVTKAPVFTLRIALPAGLTVTDVPRGVVEDFRIEEADGGRVLVLDLAGSRTGNFPVTVQSRAPLRIGDEPANLALPLLTPLGVDRFSGIVGIARDDSLKVETAETAGLVPTHVTEFGEDVAMAFRYTGAERSGSLVISRREPEVTARVDTSLRAEENRITVRSRLRYTVKHAGVESFSFTLPAELKDEFQVRGDDIREKPVTDAGDGRIRQRVVLQGRTTGVYELVVEYDLPYEGLATGESKTIAIPVLAPEDVKRDEGTYAVYREPMLEIEAETDRLEPIDPREVPGAGADVFLAFKYLVRPHALSLDVTKHEYLPVLTAVVRHLQLVTVLNEEGTARTEAVLVVKNNGLQFLSLATEAPPDTLVIFTRENGTLVRRKETPQAGKDGTVLVRMPPEAGPDDTFWVKLVWSVRGELPGAIFHDLTFRAPVVQGGEVPVLGTTWYVFPPVDRTITQTGGTLTLLDRDDSWLREVGAAFTGILPGRTVRVRAGTARTAPVVPAEVSDLAPKDQRPLRFGGRVQEPTVEVTFASPGGFVAIRVLVFLLVLAAGVFLVVPRGGRATALFVFLGVAIPLLLAPIAAAGTAKVLSAVLFGAVLAGLYLLARDLSAWMAERRKTRAAAAAAPAADAAGEEE